MEIEVKDNQFIYSSNRGNGTFSVDFADFNSDHYRQGELLVQLDTEKGITARIVSEDTQICVDGEPRPAEFPLHPGVSLDIDVQRSHEREVSEETEIKEQEAELSIIEPHGQVVATETVELKG